MQRIEILEPRWHDRKLLIANWKISKDNQIVINHHDFPEPFYASGDKLRSYPLQNVKSNQGNEVQMRVVSIDELSTDLTLEEL